MLTRSQVKPGNIIQNQWLHPGRRQTFEVIDITPQGVALYNHQAGTIGTDNLAHPGWAITQTAPLKGDAK